MGCTERGLSTNFSAPVLPEPLCCSHRGYSSTTHGLASGAGSMEGAQQQAALCAVCVRVSDAQLQGFGSAASVPSLLALLCRVLCDPEQRAEFKIPTIACPLPRIGLCTTGGYPAAAPRLRATRAQ
eukprot:1149710-Pelagomonas_calceolata.AAC.3